MATMILILMSPNHAAYIFQVAAGILFRFSWSACLFPIPARPSFRYNKAQISSLADMCLSPRDSLFSTALPLPKDHIICFDSSYNVTDDKGRNSFPILGTRLRLSS
ncbi:hypothetical protein NXS19_003858 [Fusarium pseudograminearum]|nr:hypothetical protein NXS19_003858 [Fusarium pseudograminearum]